tara:strand:- start:984 stop:1313 length:330 start_codon:yes stop_codon:yes gene_type:complete
MKTDIVDISTIESGVQLLIETKNAIYDIEIVDGATGEVMLTGGYKVASPTKAILSGASWQNRKYEHQIRKGMTIDFFYNGDERLTTARVSNVVLFGPNESWYYDMEWNK